MKLLKLSLILIIIFSIILFSGCSNNLEVIEESVEETPEVVVNKEAEEFLNIINSSERPILVMVDNDDDNARPQQGLEEAYLIYEMVVEGGSTRFAALYKGTNTEKIGPVRSSRHYFLDYVMENDAIYTHYGWSPKAMEDISTYKINNINGVSGNDVSIFWRERKFSGDWHSAYTNIEKIKNKANEKKYATETTVKNKIKYADDYFNLSSGKTAKDISLKYSYRYKTGYTYNEEIGLYVKSIDSMPHKMQNNELVKVKNIIVQFIDDVSLGDGSDRRNLNTTGNGKGYYITNGEYVEITWSKASRKDATKYYNHDGSELIINPGKTIINIISPYADIIIN